MTLTPDLSSQAFGTGEGLCVCAVCVHVCLYVCVCLPGLCVPVLLVFSSPSQAASLLWASVFGE